MTTKAKAAPEAKPATPSTEEAPDMPKSKAPPSAKRPPRAANKPPVAAAPATDPVAAKSEKPPKEERPVKVKMIRDSFIMPENDYALLAELKKRCLQAGIHMKKSELLRAGVRGLSGLADAELIKAMAQVEKVKTGRPVKR